MVELLQSETAVEVLVPVSEKFDIFSQLIKLADAAQFKTSEKDFKSACNDKYGDQNYERLLQDPAAWRRVYAGLTQPL